MSITDTITTSGAIAVRNLDGQIDTALSLPAPGVDDRVRTVELLLLRSHLHARICDGERAAELAQDLVRNESGCPQPYLARAQTNGLFHEFTAALHDLDIALRYGADETAVRDERAAILEALGQYPEALSLRQQAWEAQATFATTAGLASILAAIGEVAEAEHLFAASAAQFRGVSPFPLAMLAMRHGRLCLDQGDPLRARDSFSAALVRVPSYAPAAMAWARIAAGRGDLRAAIDYIRPFAETSDDPCYARLLGQWLVQAGQTGEAEFWIRSSTMRYHALAVRFPHAFTHHHADFAPSVG